MTPSHRLAEILKHPLFLPLYVPTVIYAFSQGLLVPILPLYVADFGVSYAVVGVVLAGQALGMLLGDVPLGLLLRRVGQKKTMLLGLFGIGAANLAMFAAGSVVEAFVYQFIAGLSVSAYSVARHAYLADVVRLIKRGRAIAIFGGINRLGKFAGPAVGGFLAASYSLRTPFLLFGLTSGVAVLFVWLFMKRASTAASPHQLHPKAHLRHLAETVVAHRGVLAGAGSAQIFAQMLRAARPVIIPLFAADVLGLGVDDIGLIVSLSAAVDMSLFYVAGWLMDRWGRKFAIVPCFAIQAVGMALLPFSVGFGSLLAVTCLIGFGNGLGSGTMMTLGADLAPLDSRGEFLGVWRLIGDVGHTTAPLVVGNVAQVFALGPAAWVIAGAGGVAVLLFLFAVPETLETADGRR